MCITATAKKFFHRWDMELRGMDVITTPLCLLVLTITSSILNTVEVKYQGRLPLSGNKTIFVCIQILHLIRVRRIYWRVKKIYKTLLLSALTSFFFIGVYAQGNTSNKGTNF